MGYLQRSELVCSVQVETQVDVREGRRRAEFLQPRFNRSGSVPDIASRMRRKNEVLPAPAIAARLPPKTYLGFAAVFAALDAHPQGALFPAR
eukprot:1503303-Rhodomonas_salina.1